jgi:hypothetical protein
MRAIRAALLVLGCWWLASGRAQEAEQPQPEEPAAPDLDFLEYLGAWADEDDEWLAIEEWRKDNAADGEKKAEESEESEAEREDDDESE